MKKLSLTLVCFMLVFMNVAFAQVNPTYSLGIVSSQFNNNTKENSIADVENPLGVGLSFVMQMDEHFAFGLTGSYFNGDMQYEDGEETGFRGHGAFFFYPLKPAKFRPYLSTGLVYTYKDIEYTNGETTDDKDFQFRGSVGVDYHLISNISLNVDVAMYNDMFDVLGTATSVGLRYTF